MSEHLYVEARVKVREFQESARGLAAFCTSASLSQAGMDARLVLDLTKLNALASAADVALAQLELELDKRLSGGPTGGGAGAGAGSPDRPVPAAVSCASSPHSPPPSSSSSAKRRLVPMDDLALDTSRGVDDDEEEEGEHKRLKWFEEPAYQAKEFTDVGAHLATHGVEKRSEALEGTSLFGNWERRPVVAFSTKPFVALLEHVVERAVVKRDVRFVLTRLLARARTLPDTLDTPPSVVSCALGSNFRGGNAPVCTFCSCAIETRTRAVCLAPITSAESNKRVGHYYHNACASFLTACGAEQCFCKAHPGITTTCFRPSRVKM
jgi:hypothetical protein